MPEIELVPQRDIEEEAVFLTSSVDLAGRDDESGVQVRAFIGQQEQAFSLSNADGSFSLRLSPLDHTLTLSEGTLFMRLT